ncbi:unnamed protein product, partial [Vitis vinifera]
MSLIPRRSNVFDPFSLDVWDPFEVDWKETPNSHVFKADVPGLKKEELKTDTWHRVERSSGSFLRRFRLPEDAKVDQVKAAMEDGVLTVTVPKEAAKKPDVKSIQISG